MTSVADRLLRSVLLIGILSFATGKAVPGQEIPGGQAEEAGLRDDGDDDDGDSDGDAWTRDLELGGNARFFLFEIAEDFPGRNDFERGAFRLTLEHESAAKEADRAWSRARFEVHGVLSATRPKEGGFGGSGVTSVGTNGHRRVDLQTEVLQSGLADKDVRLWAEVDRINARFEHRGFSLTVGRQPITWGVNYFWPVLDLFGPFSPAAVDRDYKPGVDALRLTIPVGDFSEIEMIAAAQGDEATAAPDSDTDWSRGALGRFHVSGTDVGFLLGRFYRDDVFGAFVTGDLAGFGLRGEVLHTDVADEWQGLPGETRSSFWRATVGVDRLLSSRTSLVTEISWNGYGGQTAADYPSIAASHRVRRGEITSLGRQYSGLSLSFQASPLLAMAGALLTNWGDGSTLLQPSVVWSLSDNATATVGAFVGFGDGVDAAELPGSEYGAVPLTLWGAIKTFF